MRATVVIGALVLALLGAGLTGAAEEHRRAERGTELTWRRAIGIELDRRHAEIERLRRTVARLHRAILRGVPWAPTPHLAVIASCESGADPRAVSPGGRYRGAWQFDMATWRGVGGTGDPAAAPFPEQAYRAWLLYLRRGAQPWPVCGRL